MGLRSPFGNGPANIQSAIPQSPAPATPAPAPMRTPAAVPTPQAQPPVPGHTDQMSPDEQAMLSKAGAMSPEEQTLLAKAGGDVVVGAGNSPVQKFMQDNFGAIRESDGGGHEIKVGSNWKKLTDSEWGALQGIGTALATSTRFGAMAGAAALGAAATPELGGAGAVPAGGVGYDAGDQAVNMVKKILGIKDPDMRADLMGHVQNMLTGMAGELGGQVTGYVVAGKLASQAAQAAAPDAAAALVQQGGKAAGDLAGARAADSSTTGIPLTKDQIAGQPSPVFNDADQAAQFQQIRNAQKAQTVAKMDQLTHKMGEDLSSDAKSNRSGLSLFQGEIDRMNAKLGPLQKRAEEAAGDRQFSVDTPIKAATDELARYGVQFDKSGNIVSVPTGEPGLGVMAAKVGNLIRETKTDPGAFSEQGSLISTRVEPFGKEFDQKPGGTSVQDPLSHGGAPAQYQATGRSGSLMGPQSGVPDINTIQTRAAVAPGALGSQVRMDEGVQPGLSGSGMQASSTSSMPPNPAGPASRGVTLKTINGFVKDAQEFANFNADERSPVEKSWGKIQRAFSDVRDDAASSALQDRGNVGEAHQLRTARAEYNERIDGLSSVVADLKKDPTNIGAALLPLDNPAKVTQNMQVISRSGMDAQRIARGGILDSLVQPNIDKGTNTVGAKAVEAKLNAADPKSLRIIFGDKNLGDIRSLINIAKVMENSSDVNFKPNDPLLQKAAGILMNPNRGWTEGKDFVSSLFGNSPKAREYLENNVSGFLDQNHVSSSVSKLSNPAAQKAAVIGGKAAGAYFGDRAADQLKEAVQ